MTIQETERDPLVRFHGIMRILRIPFLFITFASCVWLHTRAWVGVGDMWGNPLTAFIFTILFCFASMVLVCCVFMFFSADEVEHEMSLCILPAITVGIQWLMLGAFYLLAGTAVTLREGVTAITNEGVLYYEGERVARRELNGATQYWNLDSHVYEVSIETTDTLAQSGLEIAVRYLVRIEARLSEDREIVEARVQSMIAQGIESHEVLQNLWTNKPPEVVSNEVLIREMIENRTLSVGYVFPTENHDPWISELQVVEIRRSIREK